MMRSLFLFFLFTLSVVRAEVPFSLNNAQQVVVQNKVLLKIKGKPISVVDVIKKMDMLFYKQFPEYADSVQARYQFYVVNFEHMLASVIDDELILLDAVEKKIEVKDGDIRETMEELFGPDVVGKLDKIGLGYEEAWDLVKKDLIVRRMVQMMVKSRAAQEVSPKEIKRLYASLRQDHPEEEKWVYQVLTIESTDATCADAVSDLALSMLKEGKMALKDAASLLQGNQVEVRLSEEYQRKTSELSPAHKTVLEGMAKKSYSNCIAQTKGHVRLLRIFYLKERSQDETLSFAALEDKLREEAISAAVARHSVAYCEKLRRTYGLTENEMRRALPEDFQPFALR